LIGLQEGTTGTATGTGGGMMAKAKEMLVDHPVEAVKVGGGGLVL
jgi:hypothetical protein